MERGGCVYIMTNEYRTTLYIGVTSNLPARLFEHTTHAYPNSFTAKYNLKYLIFCQTYFTIEEAIAREKELKGWKRVRKNKLIESVDSTWKDLSAELSEW